MKKKQDVILTIRNMKSVDELILLKVNFKQWWVSIAIWGVLIGVNYFVSLHELINLSFVIILLIARGLQKD
jgi:hypothetical protein